MFATWPMVVGALVAGFIAGFLIPDTQQKAPTGSTVAAKTETAKTETAKTAEPKRTLAPAKTESVSAPPAKADSASTGAPIKNDAVETPQKNAGNEDCERQTWPYLTPNCLDRSAQAATPDVVVKTKRAEPKAEATAEPRTPPAQQAAETTGSSKETASAPKAEVSAPKAGATAPKTEVSAPKADNTAKSAAAAPAASETVEKQAPTQAAPAPEKPARRPAARARAETSEEPLRPRADRYRNERRYAGQLDDDDYDRPVYIERGGRLYLAPEYHYRLRERDRYWRD